MQKVYLDTGGQIDLLNVLILHMEENGMGFVTVVRFIAMSLQDAIL